MFLRFGGDEQLYWTESPTNSIWFWSQEAAQAFIDRVEKQTSPPRGLTPISYWFKIP